MGSIHGFQYVIKDLMSTCRWEFMPYKGG